MSSVGTDSFMWLCHLTTCTSLQLAFLLSTRAATVECCLVKNCGLCSEEEILCLTIQKQMFQFQHLWLLTMWQQTNCFKWVLSDFLSQTDTAPFGHVCVSVWEILAWWTPSRLRGPCVNLLSPAKGSSAPLSCSKTLEDTQLKAPVPSVRPMSYLLFPCWGGGLRRDSGGSAGRIVVPVCTLMGPHSSL